MSGNTENEYFSDGISEELLHGLTNLEGDLRVAARTSSFYFKGKAVLTDFVRAHMWLNLAAAQELEAAAVRRDLVAAEMAPEEIAEAQRLAREWTAEHGQ